MAKMKVEKNICYDICGVLDKTEDGRYTITVEDKNSRQDYDLDSMLSEMLGSIVTIKSSTEV